MPIEITNTTPQRVPYDAGEGSQINGTRSAPNNAQQETGKPSTFDTVSITDTAAHLQKLNQSVNDLPVVDTQHVEAVRQAIANGSYTVDNQRTAAKMLGFESALGGHGK